MHIGSVLVWCSTAYPDHPDHCCVHDRCEFSSLTTRWLYMRRCACDHSGYTWWPWECKYRLSTYGISMTQFPLLPDTYEMNREKHLTWVHSCFGDAESSTKVEAEQPAIGIQPSANDVLYKFGNLSSCKAIRKWYKTNSINQCHQPALGYPFDGFRVRTERFVTCFCRFLPRLRRFV